MAVELIAECSTNHGGSMALAHEFIQRFAEAGATFVKFQLTRVEHLRKDDPQYDWFAKAEFHEDQFAELKAATEAAGAQFLLTVYHAADVQILTSLGMDIVKIGSGESHEPFVRQLALDDDAFSRVIVSLGVQRAIPFPFPPPHLDFLGCVTKYPAPNGIAAATLLAPSRYPLAGWSDHAIGLGECASAICCGARIIEKHVCLPNQARPERPWEADVRQFQALRSFTYDDSSRFLGRWQA